MLTLQDGQDIVTGGFDGCYTYFASDQVSWASQPGNWPTIARSAWLNKPALSQLHVDVEMFTHFDRHEAVLISQASWQHIQENILLIE